jgi:colicin import membrane protein
MATTSPRVTRESVFVAATSIAAAGGRPSVRLVIDALGGGSPNAVSPLLAEWRASAAVIAAPEISLSADVVRAVAVQVKTAVAAAVLESESRAADVQADAELIAQAGKVAEVALAEATAALADASKKVLEQAGELAEVRRVAADAVAEAQAFAARERQAAEDLRQDLVRAQIRCEQVPVFTSEIKELRESLEKSRQDLAGARQSEAVAIARHTAAESAAASLSDRFKAMDERAKEDAARDHGARAEVNQAKGVIDALRVQVERLEAAARSTKEKIGRPIEAGKN